MTMLTTHESLLAALLGLDTETRQQILDAVAERTGQRAERSALIERHAVVTPAKWQPSNSTTTETEK